jgi:hypothetical protein
MGLGWLRAEGAGQIESSFFDGVSHPAIAYLTQPADDAIERLSGAIDAGTAHLEFEDRSGYLRPLLRALAIEPDTQLAVFSKTSLQAPLISPRNPRTIFFNDTAAVAWPRGGFIEIAVQDPVQGAAFYMLEQRETPAPHFVRPPGCLTCHVSYATLNVPGLLVRSVATTSDGRSLSYLSNATPDHRTPFEERWAGWFVTGSIGGLRHLGNTTVAAADLPDATVTAAATPLASLAAKFDTTGYLSAHSDIAALLVFTHQMHMMNMLTRIGWQTRMALADKEPDAARAMAAAAVDFVDYLLFVDEPPLPGPVKGASGFAERFSALGPRDHAGRSLRELDLQTRVLKYPCSYLIYSAAFDALPAEAKTAIYARLWRVLSGEEATPRYRRLPAHTRRAIVEILRDTKSDLPPYFVAAGVL